MKSKDEIIEGKQYIDRLREEYIQNHIRWQERDELIAENNIEKRDIRGYHGREILELLQNADDAYQKSIDIGEKPECALKIAIYYKDYLLTVTNTGTAFDEAGIRAIVQGNNSPKIGKYIGNKGTGFRSVLNWAEKVRIFSGNYKIEFSQEIADSVLQKISKEPQIKKQFEKQREKKCSLYIPILAVPINIEDDNKNDATTIEVVLDPDKQKDDFSVLEQIENIDLRILLFLPNTSQIDIITEDKHITYKRDIIPGVPEKFSLKKEDHGADSVELEETFLLFQKKIANAAPEEGILKDIQFSVAVPEDIDAFRGGNVYSFFPLLDTESPFACVLHASYALGDHRNTINVSQTNKEIIKQQLLFLVEIADWYVEKSQYDMVYKILVPVNFVDRKWKFTTPFAKFGLEDYYLELLSQHKIFCTVNNEPVSIKDHPKMMDGSYPECFVGKNFARLLRPIQDKKVVMLIENLAKREGLSLYYEENELLLAVNVLSDSWSISQRIEVFLWWNKKYPHSLPCLLKTQEGRWLTFQEECYLLIGDFDAEELPSWVKISALHREYQQELFTKAEETQEVINIRKNDKEPQISRIICQNNLYPTIGFKYRDRSNIISTVNTSVDTYDKAIEFVKWLWKNYGREAQWNPPGRFGAASFKYNFPCKKNIGMKDSEKLYFGADYGNLLSGKLFDNSYSAFPPLSEFLIGQEDEEVFREFISKFGVKKYPVIEVQDVSPLDTYTSIYEEEIRHHGDLGYSTNMYCKYRLPYIKNLMDLLMKLSTLEIVEWITKDSMLFACLCTPFYAMNAAEISYCGNRQQNFRTYYGRIKNYILEVFNEVKWIELDGKRYSPRQILKGIHSKSNQRFAKLVPIIGTEWLEEIAQKLNVGYESIRDIFERFDLRDNVTELSSEEFYDLMLRLPTIDISHSAELSKAIYRIVEKTVFTRKFEDSDNKVIFFKEGKLLVKYQGQLQYFPAKYAYLPSAKIINKKTVPIVEKGQRTNNEIFMKIFGCQEYNKEYLLDKRSIVCSAANDEFQKYFRDFQKYACAYAEYNDNIQQYGKRLKIVLVDKISVWENGNYVSIDDEYMYIRDKVTSWYITVFGSTFDIYAVSEIIENIYTNIANTSGFEAGKLGELFRATKRSSREFLIKKEFGSLDVIEDACYQSEIRNNFVKALRTISHEKEIDETEIDNIDFENFNSIENAPYIIDILKKWHTDIQQFKEAGFVYGIDLTSYYIRELRHFLQREERQYKDFKFTCAKSDVGMQDSFVDEVRRFIRFEIPKVVNSVYFNFEENVVAEFGEWRKGGEVLSADDAYAKNYEKMNPERLYEDEITNNSKAQGMIYFGRVDEFCKWMKACENREQENRKEKEDDAPYLRYRNIVPQICEIVYSRNSYDARNVNDAREGSGHVHTGTYTQTAAERRSKNQKTFGNKGELMVYNLLCRRVGKEKVFPRSEAFVELGIIKPGQATSGEYDISYIDENGTEYYVEVKTSDGNFFIISPGELRYAEENSDRYKLFLVYDVDAKQPSCVELPKKFWDDPKFKKKEIVERIEFQF